MEQVETRHRQFEGKKLNSLFLRFLGSPSNIIIRLICILRGEFSVYRFFFCLLSHFCPSHGMSAAPLRPRNRFVFGEV